ncbi:MAG TPA: ACP S-malonyltransferase [Xanthomonadales bacterium]|nr:ACP S-malonyltransferase [Xanthomonadales bacterium]
MKHTAFLFPGQGSQAVGMLDSLSQQSSLVEQTFDEASQAIDVDLWEIVQRGPKERLDQTEITQPAMLAADIACWRVWKEQGGFDPQYMAGHSLGEYAALVAAGMIEFTAAVALVAQRARLMQQATPAGTGAMAAILGLEDAPLQEICESAAQGQIVACANFNSPGQTVIAGNREAVERACLAAKESGAKRALALPVSVPSHCGLMRNAAEQLEPALLETVIKESAITVLHNADVANHAEAAAVRKALAEQLWKPVRWTETIAELVSRGVTRFVECGPGGVLAGLNRRNAREADTRTVTEVEAMKKIIQEWN